jgi:hypothetical protein
MKSFKGRERAIYLSRNFSPPSADYFAESINSEVGFFGYQCDSYFAYVFGWCKARREVKLIDNRIRMGEHCEQK